MHIYNKLRYILMRMGVQDQLDESDLGNVKQGSSGGHTESLAKQYFAKVPRISCQRLFEMYKFDFEAFGYDPGEYLRLCGTNVTAHLG